MPAIHQVFCLLAEEGSNTAVHNQRHSFKSKVLSRKGSGNGIDRRPMTWEGLVRPRSSLSKEGGDSTKPEPNHVQSTTLETSSYGMSLTEDP